MNPSQYLLQKEPCFVCSGKQMETQANVYIQENICSCMHARTHTLSQRQILRSSHKHPPHTSVSFDGEAGDGALEGGPQIEEEGGTSLWVAPKKPQVILLARHKHCGMLSNTTSDLHVFGHTHTRTHRNSLRLLSRHRLSLPDSPHWVFVLQGYIQSHYFTWVRLAKFKESCFYCLDTQKSKHYCGQNAFFILLYVVYHLHVCNLRHRVAVTATLQK